MISQIKQKGFTIVELLIVIVVIAILAAISMAAYTSITARANTSTASAAAKAVRDVAQTFNGANGVYPTTRAEFISGGNDSVAKMPSDINFQTGTSASAMTKPTDAQGPKTVKVIPYGSPIVGFKVIYWDYAKSTPGPVETSVGDTSGTAATNAL